MTPQASIERRIASVSAVTGLSTAISIAIQLASVPICLRFWGKDAYGSWLALLAAFTVIRTVDVGFVGYVGNKLNMQYHQDERALRLTLASAVWGVALLGAVQLLLLMVLFASDGIGLILHLPQNSVALHDAALALFVLCISWTLTGSYCGIVHRLLIPMGMMYQGAWWSMSFQVTQFAALIAAAWFGLGLLHTALLFASVQALIYAASAFYIRVRLPRYFPWWAEPSRAVGIKDLWGSLPFSIAGVLQQGSAGGLVMVVAAFLGPAVVPAFATVRTLSNLWTTLINVLTQPMFPEIVRFHAKGQWAKLIVIHKVHWLLVGSAVNLSILVAYPSLESVYGTWTRHHLILDKPLLGLLLGTVSLSAIGALMSSLLAGINRSDYVLTSAAIKGGLVVLMALVLVPIAGTTGLGLALLGSEAISLAVTVGYFFRLENSEIDRGSMLPPLLCAGASTGLVILYLASESAGLSYRRGIYWFALAGTILAAVYAWRGLDDDIKVRLRSMRYFATA